MSSLRPPRLWACWTRLCTGLVSPCLAVEVSGQPFCTLSLPDKTHLLTDAPICFHRSLLDKIALLSAAPTHSTGFWIINSSRQGQMWNTCSYSDRLWETGESSLRWAVHFHFIHEESLVGVALGIWGIRQAPQFPKPVSGEARPGLSTHCPL